MRIKTADEFSDLQLLLHQVRTMPCDESAKRQFLGLLQAQEGKVIRFTKRDLSRPFRDRHRREVNMIRRRLEVTVTLFAEGAL